MSKNDKIEVEDEKQLKHTVTYRKSSDREVELYKWVESKSEIGGPANAIKLMLFELMKKDKEKNNVNE